MNIFQLRSERFVHFTATEHVDACTTIQPADPCPCKSLAAPVAPAQFFACQGRNSKSVARVHRRTALCALPILRSTTVESCDWQLWALACSCGSLSSCRSTGSWGRPTDLHTRDIADASGQHFWNLLRVRAFVLRKMVNVCFCHWSELWWTDLNHLQLPRRIHLFCSCALFLVKMCVRNKQTKCHLLVFRSLDLEIHQIFTVCRDLDLQQHKHTRR